MTVKIPKQITHRCLRPGCGGTMKPLKHTVFADADGMAMVDTRCSNRCGMNSVEYWTWRR